MLEVHQVEYWYSTENLAAGNEYPKSIDKAVRSADLMLVVVSKNAIESAWVFAEIRGFRIARSEGVIVPLLIEDMTREELSVLEIADIQNISFADCLLHGFESLFKLLDRPFLQPQLKPRGKDRRVSPTRERMRFGFWKAYHAATGRGQFEPITMDREARQETVGTHYVSMGSVTNALYPAAQSYLFFRRTTNEKCESDHALEEIVEEIWLHHSRRPRHAAVLIELIAEMMYERFRVDPIDRRNVPRASATKAATAG